MISPIKNVFSIATAVELLGKRGPERHTPVSSGDPESRVFLVRCSSVACQFFFGDLSIPAVPSRHADAYDLASFRMG